MQISASSAFFATLGVALIVAVLFVAPPKEKVLPNVLVITIDSLRADHMGVYGYDKPTTPFLDSLFKKGVVFDNAYIPAFLTFQTDASLLSGLYPSEHHMRTWTTPIRDDVTLVSDVLELYGYSTHAFASPPLRSYFGLYNRFDTYAYYPRKNNFDLSKSEVLESLASSSPKFVIWNIYDVHVPYDKPSTALYPGTYAGKYAGREYETWSEVYERFQGTSSALTADDRAYIVASYDTGIRRVDDGLKEFFREAESAGLLENTVIIITAEHGDDLLEHGFVFHRDLYSVNTRVPLAIIYPESLRPRRIVEPVSSVDIPPTITALVGIPVMESGSGVNLLPAMLGKEKLAHDVYLERAPFGEYAVVSWPWKYILRNPSRDIPGLGTAEVNEFFTNMRRNDVISGDELYNLSNDPYEQVNLLGVDHALDSALQSKVLQFKKRMEEAHKRATGVEDSTSPEVLFTYP